MPPCSRQLYLGLIKIFVLFKQILTLNSEVWTSLRQYSYSYREIAPFGFEPCLTSSLLSCSALAPSFKSQLNSQNYPLKNSEPLSPCSKPSEGVLSQNKNQNPKHGVQGPRHLPTTQAPLAFLLSPCRAPSALATLARPFLGMAGHPRLGLLCALFPPSRNGHLVVVLLSDFLTSFQCFLEHRSAVWPSLATEQSLHPFLFLLPASFSLNTYSPLVYYTFYFSLRTVCILQQDNKLSKGMSYHLFCSLL